MLAPDLIRRATEEEEVEKMRDHLTHIFAASYNSVTINISQCNRHDNEFLIEAEALGVKLQIVYLVNNPQLGLNELLQCAFQDFCEFVIAVRNDEHTTTH